MTTKLFRLLDTVGGKQVDRLQDEIEMLHARRTRIISTLKDCTTSPTGGNSGGMREDITLSIIERVHALKAEIDAYTQALDELDALLPILRSKAQRKVLHSRYVLRKRFTDIADEMGLSVEAVLQIHRRAKRNLIRYTEDARGQ